MTFFRNGFQTFVNQQPPLAVAGDFASMNPRASALAGAGAFRSGNGSTYLSVKNLAVIGAFAWGAGQFAGSQKPAGASVLGFVANELQTSIPFPDSGNAGYPNVVRMSVESGYAVTLYTHGDFWAIPVAPVGGAVAAGDTVYARQYDGAVTNDPVAFSGTGSQATTVLTITAVTKGALVPGMVYDGTGVTAGSTIVTQLTGTPGGIGTYTVSTSATVASTTITAAAVDTGYKFQSSTVPDATATGCSIAAGTGVLTVTTVTAGAIEVGQNLTGTGVPANLFVQAQLSGTPGGAGTYQLNTIGPAIGTFNDAVFSQAKLAKISRTY
jgi:hypothetical protein